MSTSGSSGPVSPTVVPYPPSSDYTCDDLRSARLTPWLRPELLRRCIHEGLVGGEGFAVDASLIMADANRQNGIFGENGRPPQVAGRAVDEYLAVLDDAAFGATTEVTPKFLSLADPAARWTGAMAGRRSSPTPLATPPTDPRCTSIYRRTSSTESTRSRLPRPAYDRDAASHAAAPVPTNPSTNRYRPARSIATAAACRPATRSRSAASTATMQSRHKVKKI
jgi:hypothetical protein